MNYEDCLKITIIDSVTHVLDRLPHLSPEYRWALLMDYLESIATDMDNILIIPNFKEEEV